MGAEGSNVRYLGQEAESRALEYAGRLDLLSPVVLLCNWEKVTFHQALATGVFEFQINRPNGESFRFIYTTSNMEGEIINPDGDWGERVSDTNAFKMLRRFNNNTIGE